MGFSLKKTLKKITSNPLSIVNPATFISSSVASDAASPLLDKIFSGKPGPENPYGRPDLAYLYDTSRIDPLKDSSKFDYLKTNANAAADKLRLPGKTFADRYQAPTGKADNLFSELMGNINAPSSVDAVRGEVEGERMAQLLADVDEDAKQNSASSKLDFLDRGLGGPGMISDIEANALAQGRADAARTKAGTRTEYAGKELDRIKAREEAARQAQAARYAAGVESDAADADRYSKGALSDAASEDARALAAADLAFRGDTASADATAARDSLFAQLINSRDLGAAGIASDLFNKGADREIAGKEPSWFEKILNRVNFNIGG